jgi:hypothetical protein
MKPGQNYLVVDRHQILTNRQNFLVEMTLSHVFFDEGDARRHFGLFVPQHFIYRKRDIPLSQDLGQPSR